MYTSAQIAYRDEIVRSAFLRFAYVLCNKCTFSFVFDYIKLSSFINKYLCKHCKLSRVKCLNVSRSTTDKNTLYRTKFNKPGSNKTNIDFINYFTPKIINRH